MAEFIYSAVGGVLYTPPPALLHPHPHFAHFGLNGAVRKKEKVFISKRNIPHSVSLKFAPPKHARGFCSGGCRKQATVAGEQNKTNPMCRQVNPAAARATFFIPFELLFFTYIFFDGSSKAVIPAMARY